MEGRGEQVQQVLGPAFFEEGDGEVFLSAVEQRPEDHPTEEQAGGERRTGLGQRKRVTSPQSTTSRDRPVEHLEQARQ